MSEADKPLDPRELPDVFMSVLDCEQAERIVGDVERFSELISVTLKLDPTAMAYEPSNDLADARAFLSNNGARGLQLRYRFDNQTWTDTFMRLPSGKLRFVRMAGGLVG